jgi:hypothetical protein
MIVAGQEHPLWEFTGANHAGSDERSNLEQTARIRLTACWAADGTGQKQKEPGTARATMQLML